MKEAIRQRALELGFSHCGFAGPENTPSGPRFIDWLAKGHHADMAWIEKNTPKRLTPAELLPGLQSIIVLAIRYDTVEPPAPVPFSRGGQVARYARYRDYHKVLKAPLKALVNAIASSVKNSHCCFFQNANTRYGWLTIPCPTGPFTLQEAPSFPWRT